jgi:hypothetical protein
MLEFTTVSVQEAMVRTIPGRQGRFMNEYIDYIQQLAIGQAGRLRVLETENPLTIRRRLVVAAQALGDKLVIKRSGSELYFWREDEAGEEPRPRRGRRPRRQEEPAVEETTASEQPFSASEEVDYEASPELGQTPE